MSSSRPLEPDTTSPSASSPFPDPIPGILPFGSLCPFSGPSGVGKSIIKFQWCAALLHGEPILDVPTNRPVAIYYLAADRPWDPTYARAQRAAGLTNSDIHHHCLMDPGSGYDPRKLRKGDHSAFTFFEACLDLLNPPPGSLVLVDPLAPLFISGNQNMAKDVAISLQWIRQCGQRRQITLLCDANVAKLKADDDFQRPQDRISGSGAFLAYSDTVFNFAQESSDPNIRTLTWQPRCAPAGRQSFVFDSATSLLVPYTGQLEATPALSEVLVAVVAAFPDPPASLARLEALALIKQYCAVGDTQANERLLELLLSGQIRKLTHGQYGRTRLS